MAGKTFWQNQFDAVREGESPALTVEQQQEREKPQVQMEAPKQPKQEETSIEASDVAKAGALGVTGWAESMEEVLSTPDMRQSLSATVPGMVLSLADYVPFIKDKLTEASRGTAEQFASTKESIRQSMTEPARKALESELINEDLEFTDDATKLSTWIMKGTETLSRMAPDLIAGGLTGQALYKSAYETAYKSGLAKGLTEQGAKVAANKIASASMAAPTAIMATTSATGGAGVQARESIESLSWSDLQKSDLFVNNFKRIDADPENEGLSDREKLNLARTETAEYASSKIMQDPKLLTVNALSSFIGDATLGKLLAGKIGGGIVNKMVTGAAAEAPTEAAQSAMEQYAQNMILIDVAGQDVDETKGVARSALEGGLLGGVIGGGVGGVSGVVDKATGRQQVTEPDVEQAPEVMPEAEAMPEAEPVKPDRSKMTVPERRAALEASLESQRAEMDRQRIEAGRGEVQERLSRPVEPTPEELIFKARDQFGPTPGELEFREQGERDYIERVKEARIPEGLKGKPNAIKMMNKGYRKALQDFGGLSSSMAKSTKPDPRTDSMSEIVAKMGGISRSDAESEGFDPAMFKGSKTFSAKGKMSFDDAAEALSQEGFRTPDGQELSAVDVVDMLYGEVNNTESHFSTQAAPEMMTSDAQLVRGWAKSLGGTDKLNTAVSKALAGEKLGKRQAEIVEDMLDTVGSMRAEDAEQARAELETRREERNNRRIEAFNQQFQEATGRGSHIADVEAYSEMLSEMPDHYSEEQVILDELVSTAGDQDFFATSEAIEQYESGKTSLPQLLTRLSNITQQKATTYAEAKPAIQKVSEPAEKPIERVATERVEPSEAAPAAEPELTEAKESVTVVAQASEEKNGKDKKQFVITEEDAVKQGYDVDNILYSGSSMDSRPSMIQSGSKGPITNNLFDGIFASHSKSVAGSHGGLISRFVYKGDIAESSDLDNDKANEFLKDRVWISELSDEAYSDVYDAVVFDDDSFIWNDGDNLSEIQESSSQYDLGELSWELQRLRGGLAKSLGFDVVDMSDEHGTSYLLVGDGVKRLSESEDSLGSSEARAVEPEAKAVPAEAPATEVTEGVTPALDVGQSQYEQVQHTTAKGKTLDGFVWKGVSKEKAKAIDPYAFKKDDGFFIREKHKQALDSVIAATTEPTAKAQEVKPIENVEPQKEVEQATVDAEAPKVVNASSSKTVRDKVSAWAGIKFGDAVIDHRGEYQGTAASDFNPKKPRAIKVRRKSGELETISFKTLLGSDVETESIDAVARGETVADKVQVKPETQRSAIDKVINQPEPEPLQVGETLEAPEVTENKRILDAVNSEVKAGFKPKNNNDLKIVAAKVFGVDKPSSVTNNQLKAIQEAFEAVSIVDRRAKINAILAAGKGSDKSVKMAYDLAVNSYESQPNLDVRTKRSSDLQAYSTPTPMSLLANIAAGVNSNTSVYEPTAGNGLLLITANPEFTIANELDPVRASSLAWTGFDVTVNDATANNLKVKVDSVLANPPFGPMPKDANGDRPVVSFEDYQGKSVTLKEIDHVISRAALEAMKDNGKATLIIGANMKEPGVYKGNQKSFLNWLYSNYNVKFHIELDGSMYKGQGAAFPTQMIVIDGRARTGTGKFAPIKGAVKRIDNWSDLYDNFKEAGLLDSDKGNFKPRAKGDGVVSSNTESKTELREGVSRPSSELRVADRGDGTRAGDGFVKSIEPTGKRSKSIGKPTDGTVNSQPDIKQTGMVGTENIPGGGRTDAGPSVKTDAVRVPVKPLPESTGVNNKTSPKQIDVKVDKANDYQAHYKTASNGFNQGVLTPNNMASYTQAALSDIQERHGSVDKFVIDRLGYDGAEDLHKAFMGLQADAIALAVDNIENGRAIVIGDQTGVGKGRQAAGVIRYALQQGKTPIFVSQKPNLFTDMYDDLADIGVTNFTPLIMNQDNGFVSKGGKKLFNHSATERAKLLKQAALGSLPEGYNGLFLTYSQIASDSKGLKRNILDSLQQDAVIILDESHSAAGESKTGGFFQSLVNNAFGVTYLSATYAKRPDNMMLYMRTDLGLATDSKESLLDSVVAGGLGMQNYIAGKLAQAGQMVRRERSFDGISINNNVIPDTTGTTAKSFDKATSALRSIQSVSSMWAGYVETYLADYIQMEHGLDTSVGGNKADSNINVTSFSSVVHNNIAQLALSLKARETGRMAVKAIESGKRPVIALDNTLGSALQTYMSDNGLSIGDKAVGMNYATVLRNALDGVLAYSVKEPGAKKGQKFKMPISKIQDPALRAAYDRALKEINAMAKEDIPGSPIDAIRDEIKKAGYSVSEITGRNVMIDYANNNEIINRPSDEMDRRAVVDKFNRGDLDVLILNQAGSTGLSIHASEKFADQKPRHMIVAQPSLDINTYMQMLGRVNRTGQVALPSYDNVWLNLPSEKRPAAVLSRKMSSLNANTSGNTESATSVESVDILNQYGDQVVSAFVEANKDYLNQYNPKLTDVPDVDTAVYFLGKLAVLPVNVQEDVLGAIESEYRDLISYLDSTGQNELNMTEVDLDAKPISQKIISEGKKGAGVFSDPVYLTKVDAKAIGRSPTWDQVTEALAESNQDVFDKAISTAKKDPEFKNRLERRLSDLKETHAELVKAGKDTSIMDAAILEQENRIDDYLANVAEIENMFKPNGLYSYGSFVNVVIAEGESSVPGVIAGLSYKHESGNPYAASKWKMRVMVADRVNSLDIPLSMAKKGSIEGKRWDDARTMASRFNREAEKPARETRYIMTGNLVEAQSRSVSKGQIKPITLADGRIIQAMITPRSFSPDDGISKKVNASTSQMAKWLTETRSDLAILGVANRDNSVVIRRRWNADDKYSIEMPKSVQKGKKYWGDPRVERIIGEQAVKGGGAFTVNIDESQMKKLVKVINEISPLAIKNDAQITDFNERTGKKEKDFNTRGIVFSQESIASGKPKGIKAAEANVIAKMFVNEYKGAAGVKVKVFQLQKEAMNYLGIDADPSVLRNAVYAPWKSEVVLVADNLNNAKDAREKLRHEILAHHGLMRVVGQDEWRNIVNLVSMSRNSKSLSGLWKDIDRRYQGSDENAKAEEVIAKIAEVEPSKLSEWGDRIIAAVIRALRKVGFITDKITQPEIRNIIRIVGERIKTVGNGGANLRNDIKFSNELTSPEGFSIPDETRKDAILRSIADKYRRLKITQKAIKEQGGVIGEEQDVYLAEELFHGKIGEDLRVMEEQYIKPLTDFMGDKNISSGELDLYLIAKHAPERNAQIAKINPEMPDGGSGMTDAEASAILQRFNAEGRSADMTTAANFVYGMLNSTKQRLVSSGLETGDVVEAWDATYQNYVPLKGFAENEVDAEGNKVKGTGKGFSIQGKETMRAMGRRTIAESPIAYAVSDSVQSAIRARKNEVAQSMLNLVNTNPDPELWKVFTNENPDTTRQIVKRKNPETGKLEDQVIVTPMPMFAMKDKYLGAKVGGEQYYIKLKDPRLMEAMANLGTDQAGQLTMAVGKVTRLLSAMITSYNPEFALSNFARDVQTAVYNVLAEAKIEGGKALGTKDLAKKMVRDLPNSFKALKAGLRDNNFDGEWGSYFKEYLDAGAKTGWFVQKDIDDIKSDIQRAITTTGPGAKNALIRSKDKLIKFVDDYNDIVENASRLSVYVNSRRQGLTEKQAASLAKNLTVNFNRKGELSNTINALYMFFNASIQGTANMLRAVMTPADKSKKIWDPEFYNMTQKIAMALPIATFAMAQINREWGGDDDDGKAFYDKVPSYLKETNFIFMIPGSEGDFIKIPMPYGYNFFAAIGSVADEVINENKTPIQGAFDSVAAFAGAFSPLGSVSSDEMSKQVIKTATPSLLKPFVEMATNENFTGAPIYKEQNPFGLKVPDAYNAQRRTWEWAKGLSEFLNDLTGGNEFKSGVVDIAPETWQHLAKFAGGGLGSLFGRSQDLVVKSAKGEDVESRDIPFFRKYIGSISESVDIAEMYKRFDEIKVVEKQSTMLPSKERIQYIRDNRQMVKLVPMAKGIGKEISNLNSVKKQIEASKLPDDVKQARIKRIEEKKRILASRFNKRYNEAVSK